MLYIDFRSNPERRSHATSRNYAALQAARSHRGGAATSSARHAELLHSRISPQRLWSPNIATCHGTEELCLRGGSLAGRLDTLRHRIIRDGTEL